MNREQVAKLIEQHNIAVVKVGAADMDGVLRGKRVLADEFLESTLDHGTAQCDVIFGWDIAEAIMGGIKFTGWHTGFPDIVAKPDLNTFRLVPWEGRCALVLCDYYTEHGDPVNIAPRQVLRRVVERAAKHGYIAQFAAELELRLFREDQYSLRQKRFADDLVPLGPGFNCYSLHRASADEFLLGKIRDSLNAHGVPVEGYNREHGPGMYEINIRYTEALEAADRTLLLKTTVKEIANSLGLTASFMAKWHHDQDGSSGHTHQSLRKGGRNVFFDRRAPHHMSTTMRHYLGGLLATIREFAPLFAPTINSYKRYVPGTWAPTTATWGFENRTAGVRVIAPRESATRLEFRIPGADLNPYLAFAACLAGGLHGIEHKIEPPEETKGSAYDLPMGNVPRVPSTLEEATELLAQSELAREYFGAEFVEHFVATRRWEVAQYQRIVGDWERERYLEMV
ncbi:MAG: glutamine synthetase [Deinococcus sp.]|nr:glutamine synthetase [Deinococcus sp.]